MSFFDSQTVYRRVASVVYLADDGSEPSRFPLSDSYEYELVRDEKAKVAAVFDSVFMRTFEEKFGAIHAERESRRNNTWIGGTCEGWDGGLKSTVTKPKRNPEHRDIRWGGGIFIRAYLSR